MVYKKCPGCGEEKVPVARKCCSGCGFNISKASAADDEEDVKPQQGEVEGGGTDADKVKQEENEEDTESTSRRPRRTVRQPSLLRHELAVAVAVQNSIKSSKVGKGVKQSYKGVTRGKRGALSHVSRGRHLPLSSSARHPMTSASRHSMTPGGTTVRALLAQRRPRGRPRHGEEMGLSRGVPRAPRGAGSSGGAAVGSRWQRDDEDDDDFGLTSHQRRQIHESIDQNKGQKTRQLIPRRAATSASTLSSVQLSRGNSSLRTQQTDSAEDSASTASSKSESPCPTEIEDLYQRLPTYRRLQYSIVLGDINQKFLNQSFNPL